MTSKAPPIKERFPSLWIPEPTSGCWLWTGPEGVDGYGRLRVNGRKEMAHRLSWLIFRGPIPDGLCVCHHCDNRMCVNPRHLFIGTRFDNNADMVRKGRQVVRRGERHHYAKLNNDAVRQIIAAHKDGAGYARLGRRFGVTRQAVYVICRRGGWSHLNS